MVAEIVDGKKIAAQTRAALAQRIAERTGRAERRPGLVTILVGDDPASKVYVGRKQRESKEIGMHSESAVLAVDCTQKELVATIVAYNQRPDIDGILVQMPLPKGLDEDAAIRAIDPCKDVDGLHPMNQGALFTGKPGMRPCTPAGCMRLLESCGYDPAGKHAVVVGRSRLVGKPIAIMMLDRHATVTICHSRTADLAAEVGRADIVIAAVGSPALVRGEWIKPGAFVLDVGINRVDGKLVGDVDTAAAAERAGWITPVPGGVGPMTVAMLLENTLTACELRDGDQR